MFGFDALGEFPVGDESSSSGTVVVVHGDQANFAPTGTAYTPTTDFAWGTGGTSTVTGTGAATLGFTAAAVGQHDAPVNDIGSASVTLPITAAASAAHGVSGTGSATLDLPDASSGAHGISGSESATLSFSAAGQGAHGISGAATSTLTLTPAAAALHLRYEVHGIVKQGGVLVNRRVRVYRRDTGALIAEGDTVAGAFAIATGFAQIETYIVPINLDDAATDWLPPVANRVLTALAQDA